MTRSVDADRRVIAEAVEAIDAELRRIVVLPTADRLGALARLKAQLLTPRFLAIEPSPLDLPSPVISVLLPTRNRAHAISEAIDSVRQQSYDDWELVVVDDGSTDDTSRVVAPYLSDRRIRCVTSTTRPGPSAARNQGLRLARGSFIAYIDSDNVWYPDFLRAAMTVFASDSGVDCVYGALESEEHGSADCDVVFHSFDRNRLLEGNFIDLNTVVHRASLIVRYGGFDETLARLVDWDLLLRLTEHKAPQRVPVLAVRYRVVDSQRVSDTQPYEESRRLVRSKWHRSE